MIKKMLLQGYEPTEVTKNGLIEISHHLNDDEFVRLLAILNETLTPTLLIGDILMDASTGLHYKVTENILLKDSVRLQPYGDKSEERTSRAHSYDYVMSHYKIVEL